MNRRAAGVVGTLALVALLGVLAAPTARSGSTAHGAAPTRLQSGILVQLNEIRAQHGLQPLHANARLAAAAAHHSHELGVSGTFQHESLDGTSFWKRIARWYGSAGYRYWSVGENLLWSAPDVDAPGALDLWMHSPEHRANILNSRWREIGVSAQHFASAPGVYKGLEVTIITTDFGFRRL